MSVIKHSAPHTIPPDAEMPRPLFGLSTHKQTLLSQGTKETSRNQHRLPIRLVIADKGRLEPQPTAGRTNPTTHADTLVRKESTPALAAGFCVTGMSCE